MTYYQQIEQNQKAIATSITDEFRSVSEYELEKFSWHGTV